MRMSGQKSRKWEWLWLGLAALGFAAAIILYFAFADSPVFERTPLTWPPRFAGWRHYLHIFLHDDIFLASAARTLLPAGAAAAAMMLLLFVLCRRLLPRTELPFVARRLIQWLALPLGAALIFLASCLFSEAVSFFGPLRFPLFCAFMFLAMLFCLVLRGLEVLLDRRHRA